MSSQLYTLDLGFNWNSETTGAAFGYEFSVRPLQFGFVNPDDNRQAIWQTGFFHDDQLRFHITDITHSATETPTRVADTVGSGRVLRSLAVAFANPVEVAGAFPFQVPEHYYVPRLGTSSIPGLEFIDGELVPLDDNHSTIYNAENDDWQVARWAAGGSAAFTFDGNNRFTKMSVKLVVAASAESGAEEREFLFDPEIFVGSTENSGGG